MIGLLWQFLAGNLGDDGNGAPEGDQRESDEQASRFAGSMLDWSVNYAEGAAGSQQAAAREIAAIQEQAELLDDQERYRT